MFDIGMAEMLVIGVVALIVVGPKDLPIMFRRAGQFVGKLRGMARDFQRAMDQAADDSGLRDVADSVKTATSMKNLGLDDAAKSLAAANADWETRKAAKDKDKAKGGAKDGAKEKKADTSWMDKGNKPPARAAAPKTDSAPAAEKPAAEPEPATKPAEGDA